MRFACLALSAFALGPLFSAAAHLRVWFPPVLARPRDPRVKVAQRCAAACISVLLGKCGSVPDFCLAGRVDQTSVRSNSN